MMYIPVLLCIVLQSHTRPRTLVQWALGDTYDIYLARFQRYTPRYTHIVCCTCAMFSDRDGLRHTYVRYYDKQYNADVADRFTAISTVNHTMYNNI